MTAMRSNIKIFKIQNGGRLLLESIRNAITRLQMDRLGRNLSDQIDKRQYGSLKGRSTTHALIDIVHHWSKL